MRLKDKVAIITGAGRGIGKAYAERFVDEGARVVIADVREGLAKETADELGASGETMAVHVDVSDRSSTDTMAAHVLERWGSIDILVNNAGLYGDLEDDPSFEYLQKVMAINMYGVWNASASVVPAMVRQRKGKIVNIASVGAFMYHLFPMAEGVEQLPTFDYSWSKWNVVGLSRFMAGSLGINGITVNCIAPGQTRSEATISSLTPEVEEIFTNMSAMRTALEPADIAGACLFFASDDSDLVTGQTLCVDAGIFMG